MTMLMLIALVIDHDHHDHDHHHQYLHHLIRYVGTDFPWLGKAPKHGLWAEEEEVDSVIVSLFLDFHNVCTKLFYKIQE